MKTYHARLKTPFAVLGIETSDSAVTGIDFLSPDTPELAPETPLAAEACRQLRAYLKDPSFRFDLPLETRGTDFQRRVWRAMRSIPPGRAKSYGEVAEALHSAPRAVGRACGANPLPVVIPCHRVVGKAGLGGFAHAVTGEFLDYKRWLLDHEGYRPGAA